MPQAMSLDKPDAPRWRTVEQIADEIQWHRETLWRHIRSGRVPPQYVRHLGKRSIRISADFAADPVLLDPQAAEPAPRPAKASPRLKPPGKRGRPKGSRNKPRG